MSARRALAGACVFVFLLAWPAGCGGLSKADADIRCNQDQTSNSACFDASVFAQCESCFERCGDDCAMTATCPAIYTCPGDTPSNDAGP